MPGLAATLAALALATPADAVTRPAHVIVTGCDADHMTVIGSLKLTGKAARKAHGAQLQMQFQAMPLFGLPRPGVLRALGTKTKGSGQETFTGLPADSWAGVMSWRFKKGSRTVLAGVERSQPGRVGGTSGSGLCTLAEGLKPIDKTPPFVYVSPLDDIWHHGPAQVTVFAQDDFSGVRSVSYSVDGGLETFIRNGSTFTIDSEGAHKVHLSATDVAGNSSSRDVVIRVDASAPTKPQVTQPYSVTASTTPSFAWTEATDSGSGIKGYILVLRRASDGSAISFTPTDANTRSLGSPQALTDGQTYTASVVAVDNTDTPFSTESDPFTFRVDTKPEITSSSPADGGILSGSGPDANLTLTLDRAADPSTVAASTVVLARSAGGTGSVPSYSVTCDASCTTITVDPSGTLPEGRYSLTLNGVKSQEGVAIPGTVHFAVYFYDESQHVASVADTPASCAMGVETPNSTMTTTLMAAPTEKIRVSFNFSSSSGTGSGVVRVNDSGNVLTQTSNAHGSGSSGSDSFEVTLGSSATHALTFELYVNGCTAGNSITFTVTNLIASRTPT